MRGDTRRAQLQGRREWQVDLRQHLVIGGREVTRNVHRGSRRVIAKTRADAARKAKAEMTKDYGGSWKVERVERRGG